MNIKELYYYHDLVRTKNFSQVAADFNISQPTVTMAIKRLEESFGTTFFMRDRSHHQLTVTSTGLQFDQHVQRIIEELEIAQKELARAKQERISFGLPPIIGSWYFPASPRRCCRQDCSISWKSLIMVRPHCCSCWQKASLIWRC